MFEKHVAKLRHSFELLPQGARYQIDHSLVLPSVSDSTAWSHLVGVSTAWTVPGIPLRWDVHWHLSSRQQHVCGWGCADTAGALRIACKTENGFVRERYHSTPNPNGIPTNDQTRFMGWRSQTLCSSPMNCRSNLFFISPVQALRTAVHVQKSEQAGQPWSVTAFSLEKNEI